ncbi:TspO/MBR family protein [Nonomuraea sp. C10]|uniref:TspO/MBR family protein n=1 Tax=Nonomuraea sp. C10 TaxID=2600577 RepID=UPI0011CD816B|nr:TspO/MBR family protein [Nonomuraea sp. C10]TXK42481.1 tryptophan-rich sensory protein [Nonomuraea sp. C10]
MKKTLLATALGTAAAAALGGIATRSGRPWFQKLDKPSWQPPPAVFPLVWNPLYALIAYGGARALDRAGDERAALGRTLAANLALNAAWPALFFGVRSPRLALAEIVALNTANVLLVRKAMRADRTAGLLLVPYATWTAFATALNAEIVRKSPE